jgi:hypothetical protein
MTIKIGVKQLKMGTFFAYAVQSPFDHDREPTDRGPCRFAE